LDTDPIAIDSPYRVLYHYKDELAAANSALVDKEASSHLTVLLDFIGEQFKETIEETDDLLSKGLISYKHLWTIMHPGLTIYTSTRGQERAAKLDSYRYLNRPPELELTCEYIDFDGNNFGTREFDVDIMAFESVIPIRNLPGYPIQFHKDVAGLERRLLERGRMWEQLAGMHFRHFTGIAYEGKKTRYRIDSRVVVDVKTYHRFNDDQSFTVDPLPVAKVTPVESHNDSENTQAMELDEGAGVPTRQSGHDALTEEQCTFASPIAYGFSFTEKRWLEFLVPRLRPIDWNPDCFKQLVLPSAQKDLVQALVSQHLLQELAPRADDDDLADQQAEEAKEDAAAFDDIVKGKGRGLVLVLHGPPGVGKTLTAETVAEYARRPLYSVSAGELGTNVKSLESHLTRVLDLAVTWRCVLLLDEADVFLARRDPTGNLDRNALVSIFLRVLEYYPGMLFMTSNAIAAFDDAFQSRIHVPLFYRPLDLSARREVWQNFLGRSEKSSATTQSLLDDTVGMSRLADAPLNGRQIKNIVRTARSLAAFRGVPLDVPLLEQVVGIQIEFETSLKAGRDGAA
jgi:hypothetical protein